MPTTGVIMYFIGPEGQEPTLVTNFLIEAATQCNMFMYLTMNMNGKYTQQSKYTGGCTELCTLYDCAILRKCIVQIRDIIVQDEEQDWLKNCHLLVLYNMAYSFLPEMRKLMNLYCDAKRIRKLLSEQKSIAQCKVTTKVIEELRANQINHNQLKDT